MSRFRSTWLPITLLVGALAAGVAACQSPPPQDGVGEAPTSAVTESAPGTGEGSPTSEAPSATTAAPQISRSGRVVEVQYGTTHEGEDVAKDALVYLPPGYDQDDTGTRYDIVYFMHGVGMDETSFLGGAGQTSAFSLALDDMIGGGLIKPTIVVTPTFYPQDDPPFDIHYAGQLDRVFPVELENDLMPAVESRFHTYAASADEAGFIASRDHRAFGGFSMGAVATWYVFIDSVDMFRYFAPVAGDSWVVEDRGGVQAPEETAERLAGVLPRHGIERDDFLIAASVGSDDSVRHQVEPQIEAMRERPEAFDTGDDGNLRFTIDEGGRHNLDSVIRQLRRTLPLFFDE